MSIPRLPDNIHAAILPPPDLSIDALIKYSVASTTSPPNLSISSLFSKSASVITDVMGASILTSLSMPPYTELQEFQKRITEAVKEGYVSFAYPLRHGSALNCPFWVLEYWFAAHDVLQSKKVWTEAVVWLKGNNGSHVHELLKTIPWKGALPREMGPQESLFLLADYCSYKWLSSTHMDQMSVVLDFWLKKDNIPATARNTTFVDSIIRAYRYSKDAYLTQKSLSEARQVGDLLTEGTCLQVSLPISICLENGVGSLPNGETYGNHWAIMVIDVATLSLRYGDPWGALPPDELLEAVNWWLSLHLSAPFTLEILPCTIQEDTHSCSVLSHNAATHFFFPQRFPLILANSAPLLRIEMFVDIINYLTESNPDFCSGTSTMTVPAYYSPNVPKPAAAVAFTLKREQKVPPASRLKKPGKAEELPAQKDCLKVEGTTGSQPPANIFIKTSAPKALPNVIHTHSIEDDETDDEDIDDGEEDNPIPMDLSDPFIDIPEVKRRARGKDKGGRKKNPLLNKLLQKGYRQSKPNKHIYRCVGESCGVTFANRNLPRTLRHARVCYRLPKSLRMEAREALATQAPSLEIEMLGETNAQDNVESHEPSDESEQSIVKKRKSNDGNPIAAAFISEARAVGRRKRHKELDLAIVKLFCIHGLPTHIVASLYWKNVMHLADSSYHPADRQKLEITQIVAEAERIYAVQLSYLKLQEDLTISCDGGTSRGRESFWTLHISAPAEDRVYLMEVREATSESHTAVWIKDFALETVDLIGRSRFSAVVCDSTGNTRASRAMLVLEAPTMLNLADIVHHFSNTLKDITIATVRAIITKFHKSHLGGSELKIARKDLCIGRGLEAIGKTRFGTIIRACIATEKNSPAIKKVVERKRFDLAELAEFFKPYMSRSTMNFQFNLSQIVKVGSPALKALTCLEANEATAADVFVFWHAFLAATQEVLIDKSNDFPKDVQDRITAILNSRHRQIFGGGNLSNTVYLAATYLDPTYLNSDLFKDEPTLATRDSDTDYTGIRHPATFRNVIRFLVDIAHKEIIHGHKTTFTQWKGKAGLYKNRLLTEMQTYARQQYPFNQVFDETLGVLSWWRSLQGSKHAQVLPGLAIKIYSVRINSMAEERTVSTFTWLTPALRSRMSVGTMSAMTQVRQFYQTESKPRRHSTPHPKVHFYDVMKKSLAAAKTDEGDDNNGVDDVAAALEEEDEQDIPEPLPDEPINSDSDENLEAEFSSPVSLQSTSLAALLSDTPPEEVTVEAPAKVPGSLPTQDADDNDISMDFCL